MVDIPITISTPGFHTHIATETSEYPFASTPPSPEEISYIIPVQPSVISHATQTDIEDFGVQISPKRQSPVHSRAGSQSRKPAHQSWAEQIRVRLASPHSDHHTPLATDPAGHSLLAPPGSETPVRPATPRADLYKGQTEASFGMTFEAHDDAHMRKSKPIPCAFSYEDQKHRMMMDWLERRGTH